MVLAVPMRQPRRLASLKAPVNKTLDAIRADRRVEHVDDERAIGNHVIVTLRQGWTFTPGEDNRVDGGETPTKALKVLRTAQPFAGPYPD